jgi:aquaporin Z
MKKYLAELIGTMTLVFFGCGAAVVAGPQVGVLGIAIAFGLALIMMAYAIGPVSGCHINPAVSLGFFTAGRMTTKDLIGYIVAQFAGATLAAFILMTMMAGKGAGFDATVNGLGQNGWGLDFLGGYSFSSAFIFEAVASFLFVVVVLGATQAGAPSAMAGLAIGLALTTIYIVGIQITGASVNPARSFGPALFVGGKALDQLWLFMLVPSLSGVAAGLAFRFKILSAD